MALSTGLAWEMLSKDATSVTVGSFLLLHGCVALQAPLLRFTHSFLPRFLPPPRISPSGSSVCILSSPRPGIALCPSSGTLALSIFWKLSSWMLTFSPDLVTARFSFPWRVSFRLSWCLQTTSLKLLLLPRRGCVALAGARHWSVLKGRTERPLASQVLSGGDEAREKGFGFGSGLAGEPGPDWKPGAFVQKPQREKTVNIPALVPQVPHMALECEHHGGSLATAALPRRIQNLRGQNPGEGDHGQSFCGSP